MNSLLYPFATHQPITQQFGANPGSYKYKCRPDGSHNGIDYGVVEGTELLAAMDGIIHFAGNDKTGYGICVKIKGKDGDGVVYGHLSKLKCKLGQIVKAGQVIGLSGNTGNSTGPHLHFEYRTSIDVCTTCARPNIEIPIAEDETPEPDSPRTTDTVNLRLAPGLDSKVVGQLPANTSVLLVPNGATVSVDDHIWIPIVLYVAKDYVTGL